MMTTNIRRMELKDLKKVKEIQDSYSYWTRSKEESESEGFFIRLLSEKDLTKQIEDSSSLNFVYERDFEVGGFITSNLRQPGHMLDEKIKLASYFNSGFRNKLEGEGYLFAKYVAKEKGVSARHIVELENAMVNEAKLKGANNMVALIALNPYNVRSWDFHNRLGWEKVGKSPDWVNGQHVSWGVIYKNCGSKR